MLNTHTRERWELDSCVRHRTEHTDLPTLFPLMFPSRKWCERGLRSLAWTMHPFMARGTAKGPTPANMSPVCVIVVDWSVCSRSAMAGSETGEGVCVCKATERKEQHLQTTAIGSPQLVFQSRMRWMRRACSVCRREFQYTSAKLKVKVACMCCCLCLWGIVGCDRCAYA